jgi:hypothetical protein
MASVMNSSAITPNVNKFQGINLAAIIALEILPIFRHGHSVAAFTAIYRIHFNQFISNKK